MEYVLKKIRSSIYCIKKIKPFLDRKTLLLLYHTLVKSHILYCITLWCFGNETMINKLQCAVNKLMRSIFNVGKRQTVSYVIKDDNLLTIRQIRDLEIATFVYKFMNKLPYYLCHLTTLLKLRLELQKIPGHNSHFIHRFVECILQSKL